MDKGKWKLSSTESFPRNALNDYNLSLKKEKSLEKIIQQRSFQESDQKRADEPLPTFTEEIAP
jgi:hypothetical protein